MRVLHLLPALLVACGSPDTPPADPAAAPAPVAAPDAAKRAARVFFVRHAEKAKDGTTDPPLTEAGRERAQCLAGILKSANPGRLLSTPFQRTRQTLAPLASAFGREVEILPADDAATWLETLKTLRPGSLTVVAGHSNTLPQLITELGGRVHDLDDHGNLPSYEYDRLFILTLDAGRATSSTTLEVCAPTPVDRR